MQEGGQFLKGARPHQDFYVMAARRQVYGKDIGQRRKIMSHILGVAALHFHTDCQKHVVASRGEVCNGDNSHGTRILQSTYALANRGGGRIQRSGDVLGGHATILLQERDDFEIKLVRRVVGRCIYYHLESKSPTRLFLPMWTGFSLCAPRIPTVRVDTQTPLTCSHPPPSMYIPYGYTEVSPVEKASVFKSNKSQAVRLPKSVALPEDVRRVDVVAIGTTRIITPEGTSWDEWFSGKTVSEDFMVERDQPIEQLREGL